jgi:hypothetical protein
MAAADLALYGLQLAAFQRGWQNMIARPNGSLALRFLLQPAISTGLAVRDGIKDARTGRSPYLWSLLSDRTQRSSHLREGIAATGKVFLIVLAVDVVYQILEMRAFYPSEALVTAVLLAFIPYLLVRGPVARVARNWPSDSATRPAA